MTHRSELESALRAYPEDSAPYLVYADLLTEAGDPHGALIAAQVERELAERDPASQQAGSDAARRVKAAREREAELLERHKAELLGPIAEPSAHVELSWRRGFVDSARLSWNWFEKSGETPVPGLIDALFEVPAGLLLRELVFGVHIESDGQGEYQAVIDALAARPRPSLRLLHVGDFRYNGVDTEISWTQLGDLSALWEAVPGLEHLELQGGDLSLGDAIRAPELRHLAIRSGGLPAVVPRQVGAASWPKLAHLSLWFGDPNYGGDAGVEDLTALLEGRGLPALRHLGLANGDFADDLCAAVAGAPLLRQLSSLDLSMGTMTDRGGTILLERREAFAHLDALDLEENYLSEEMCARLAGLCRAVRCEEQREASEFGDEMYYYPSVSE